MRRLHIALVALTVLVISWIACDNSRNQSPSAIAVGATGRIIDAYLKNYAPFGFSGAALVAVGDSVLYRGGYGIANPHTGEKITPGAIFSTGSVTKQFTATGIMYLESKGKLSTSDSLPMYFDRVPEEKARITIQQLLTHSAGLAPQYGGDNERVTRDDLMRRILDSPLEYDPGSRYEYSNAGYSMLAAIIEHVTDMPYEEFLQKSLFRPAGLQHTGLHTINADGRSVGHSRNKDLGYPSPLDRDSLNWNLIGNGGICSTVDDMFQWYRAVHDGTLLPKAARDKIFTPYIREYDDGDSFYGYGWVVQDYGPDKRLIWHNGGAMPHGWSCAVYHFEADDVLIVVFSNQPVQGSHPVDDVAMALSRIARGLPVEMPPTTIVAKPGSIATLDGVYRTKTGAGVTVSAGDNAVILTPAGQEMANLLFPSPYADVLGKYNGLTVQLVEAMATNDWATATDLFQTEMTTPEHWQEIASGWWHSFDTLGTLQAIDTVGTVARDGASTFATLRFAEGDINAEFFWMAGKCEGMRSESSLGLSFLPVSANEFAAFSGEGKTRRVHFAADSLTVRDGGQSFTAKR